MSRVKQSYRFYCVIDFEATNEENPWNPGHGRMDYPSEIIQFPAVLIDGSTAEIVGTFNRYVKPSRNPVLSRHILRLTNITQNQVNNADSFVIVLSEFENWLGRYSSKPFNDVCFITDGIYDFGKFLVRECEASRITRPTYMRSCHNIKESFKSVFRRRYYENTSQMLRYLGMSFSGTQHNGLDDSRNIARIVQYMLKNTYARLEKNQYY